jgi:hypothetical protein
MEGEISKGGTKPSWGPLLLTVTLLIVVSIATVSVSAVDRGYIYKGTFPGDFPTAKEHPYDREDYLLEGEMGHVMVTFSSQSGIGPVNLTASSDAFVANLSLAKNITIVGSYHLYELTFNIKSGIDGRYGVQYQASNESGDLLDMEFTFIEVWSENHREAADAVYVTQDIISSWRYFGDSPMDLSLEARSNLTAAIDELALAELAYSERDWTGTKTHTYNAIELIDNVESAEKESMELKEERMNVAEDVNLKTIDFLGWITYPALIIAVLAIAYIVVAIFRKIRPLPKPK